MAGRPKIEVDKDSLAYLKSLRFTWKEISVIVGPSMKTLRRRAVKWNIEAFSTVTDTELEEKISVIKRDFPNSGEVMITGHLLSQGIHVPRKRLRQSISRLGGSTQLSQSVYRRVYSVPWHIDGNHKLIKYRLIVHGGIDGFSRLITYLIINGQIHWMHLKKLCCNVEFRHEFVPTRVEKM